MKLLEQEIEKILEIWYVSPNCFPEKLCWFIPLITIYGSTHPTDSHLLGNKRFSSLSNLHLFDY